MKGKLGPFGGVKAFLLDGTRRIENLNKMNKKVEFTF